MDKKRESRIKLLIELIRETQKGIAKLDIETTVEYDALRRRCRQTLEMMEWLDELEHEADKKAA